MIVLRKLGSTFIMSNVLYKMGTNQEYVYHYYCISSITHVHRK